MRDDPNPNHLMSRSAAIFLLFVASTTLAGQQDDRVINSGSELRDWCREASEATLVGRGMTPFNWTASYWDQANTLMVKGQWRIEGSNLTVDCSITKGAQARFASVSIQGAP
ncbi:MAG: hypothetical protein WB440_12465 [Steroidobacteraceae bacterium]|jgi:hypothetical protein